MSVIYLSFCLFASWQKVTRWKFNVKKSKWTENENAYAQPSLCLSHQPFFLTFLHLQLAFWHGLLICHILICIGCWHDNSFCVYNKKATFIQYNTFLHKYTYKYYLTLPSRAGILPPSAEGSCRSNAHSWINHKVRTPFWIF